MSGSVEERMARAVEAFGKDLGGFRTGRASAALVEHITVDHYGAKTPLNQMAGISVPENTLLVVQPWDPTAIPAIEKGRVVVFVAGTGNPYFTTDTAAALRAVEIGAQVMLKATKVDGVYDKDPHVHADAVRIPAISYGRVLVEGLKVLDAAAVSLCMENGLPIVVFDLDTHENVLKAVRGEEVGTMISKEGTR